jgi:hypothetical protein
MARAIILRTKDDDKLWLVNLDELSVSQIAGAPVGIILEAEVIETANVRSAAAAHPQFIVQ